jgi:hypothetical protein
MLPEVTNIEPELFLSWGKSESRDSTLNHPLARQRAAGLLEVRSRCCGRQEVLTMHAFVGTSVHCSMQLTGYGPHGQWATAG